MNSKSLLVRLLPLAAAMLSTTFADHVMKSQFAEINVSDKGFITSLKPAGSDKEFCVASHPTALLSLHEKGTPNKQRINPSTATYDAAKKQFTINYPNGSTAVVQAASADKYFRFELISLTKRENIDAIIWGPVNTNMSGKIGDIIGVVRDKDFAIGMFGLDDNTITGALEDGDCYQMGYYVHSLDPVNDPIDPKFKEGQWFKIGGDGVNDVAFYAHPEAYFHQIFGSGAKLEPEFGSSVAYYARDRRQPATHHYSLLPGFERSRLRHMVSDAIPGVDFIGSKVALYACPDDQGIETLRTIFKSEGLPYITDRQGKWVRDPASHRPTIYWNGPVDKAIEYSKAMGFNDISRDTGEFYSTLPTTWVGQVNFGGKNITYKEFAAMCHKENLTHGGLHTLCMFLQGGTSNSVTPVPHKNLQTICRTKLAKDISPTDTEIEVTDPSFLAEKGTWPRGDDSNYLRIGGEMLRYDGISESAPWILKGIKRGHASQAQAHKAGDELVKLQQNCYNGFCPDMELLPAYAKDYAELMIRNGMDTINFDGYEVMAYTNHGYYAFKKFNRALFETYHAKTGKWPRVTGSNVFGGAWEYMNVCDLGGGNNMFDSFTGKRATQGKDIGDAFEASWFPATFGIQGWHSNWSHLDAQTLMAKAIGWDATFALSADQNGIDATGDKDAIFTAFHAWQDAREKQLFTKEQKAALRNPELKFHLEKSGSSYQLYHLKRLLLDVQASKAGGIVTLAQPHSARPLIFDLRFDAPVDGCTITLKDGGKIVCNTKINNGQLLICTGDKAYVADGNRRKIADATITGNLKLAKGDSQVAIQIPGDDQAKVNSHLTYIQMVKSELLGK